MIEHLHLNDYSSTLYRSEDVSRPEVQRLVEEFRRHERLRFNDGYHLCGDHIEIGGTEFTYLLYTPETDLAERPTGISFTHTGRHVLTGTLVCAATQFAFARERMLGGYLRGLPFLPPRRPPPPEARQFPCLLTISFAEQHDYEMEALASVAIEFARTFAFAVIKLFREQAKKHVSSRRS